MDFHYDNFFWTNELILIFMTFAGDKTDRRKRKKGGHWIWPPNWLSLKRRFDHILPSVSDPSIRGPSQSKILAKPMKLTTLMFKKQLQFILLHNVPSTLNLSSI